MGREMVDLNLKIPKELQDDMEASVRLRRTTVEEYVTDCIISFLRADIEALGTDLPPYLSWWNKK
jgi:hypothetical protein